MLAGVKTKTDLARTRKALDAAAAEAGADASREAKVAARACEIVDTELSEFVQEHLDELIGAVRDHGIELEDRLRSNLDDALAALEAVSAHEAQLMRLLLASELGTQGVVTVTEHQRDLRRALRAALDNGTVRAARFQVRPAHLRVHPATRRRRINSWGVGGGQNVS